jgi:hypothetical protein
LIDVEGERAYGLVFARAGVLNKENSRIGFTVEYADEYIRSSEDSVRLAVISTSTIR